MTCGLIITLETCSGTDCSEQVDDDDTFFVCLIFFILRQKKHPRRAKRGEHERGTRWGRGEIRLGRWGGGGVEQCYEWIESLTPPLIPPPFPAQ